MIRNYANSILERYISHKELIDKVFLSLLLIGYSVSVYLRSTDFPTVYHAAQRMWNLESITILEAHAYAYPPFYAFISIPWTFMPYQVAKMIYFYLSVTALVYSIIWLKRILSNSKTFNVPPESKFYKVFAISFIALTARFIINNFEHLQSDMFILLSMVGGLYFFLNGKDKLSALYLAIGAAIKVTPLFILFYFLWKRQWKIFSLGIFIFISLNLLPDLFFNKKGDSTYIGEWLPLVTEKLVPSGNDNKSELSWSPNSRMNQSISATLYRYLVHEKVSTYSDNYVYVNIFSLNPKSAKKIIITVVLVMGLGFAWVSRRRIFSRSDDRYIVEYALALVLILLASPVSSKPHFATMIVGHGVIIAAVYRGFLDKNYLSSLIFAFLLSTLVVDGFVGKFIGRNFEALGNVTFHAVTVGMLVLTILSKMKNQIPDN